MTRQERIGFLAEENRRRRSLRSLRELFSLAFGREIHDHEFLPYDPNRLRPAGVGSHSMLRPEGVPEFLRYHLDRDFVEKNHGLVEAFGARLPSEMLLLETCDARAYFPWLRVAADVFTKSIEWSRGETTWGWGGRMWFCVCDVEVENGFCLREGTNWGMDDEYEGWWTLNVFGVEWVEIAEDVFDCLRDY